jgi:hypothetical protein
MRVLIVLLMFLAGAESVQATEDDFEIEVSTNAPAHPVGQKLAKGAILTLLEGAQITLRDRTAGSPDIMRECGGMFEGKVEDCRPQKPGSRSSPGATRGAVR